MGNDTISLRALGAIQGAHHLERAPSLFAIDRGRAALLHRRDELLDLAPVQLRIGVAGLGGGVAAVRRCLLQHAPGFLVRLAGDVPLRELITCQSHRAPLAVDRE